MSLLLFFWLPTPFVVVASLSALAFAWSLYSRRRTERWPAITGTIEDAEVGPWARGRNSDSAQVKIRYSYAYNGTSYGGEYTRGFFDEDAANEFAFGLRGRSILIHVDPANPKRSGLVEQDVNVVVKERGPVPEGALPPNPPAAASSLKKIVAAPFASIAVAGFFAAFAINIAGWMGRIILPSFMFAAMHVGVFVVFFPAILLGGKSARNFRWGSKGTADSGLPSWAKSFGAIVFVYAIVNFILFFVQMSGGKQKGPLTPLMWRGFSGHWMVFYLFAFGMLYTVIGAPSDKTKCVNGHEMNTGSLVCPVCGAGRG